MPEYINLLIQIPLVGIFVWFSLRLSSDHRADAERRDVQWQMFIEQQNQIWLSFIKDLNEQGRTSSDLNSQRLSELAQLIGSLLNDFKAHDQRFGARGKQV